LFAVGPVTRGTFWEIVAYPDIRLHCTRLADHLSAAMREGVQASEPEQKPLHQTPPGSTERNSVQSVFRGLRATEA
jgi:hypothetical protein